MVKTLGFRCPGTSLVAGEETEILQATSLTHTHTHTHTHMWTHMHTHAHMCTHTHISYLKFFHLPAIILTITGILNLRTCELFFQYWNITEIQYQLNNSLFSYDPSSSTVILLFVFMNVAILDNSYKYDDMVFAFLLLAYFTWHNVLKIYSCWHDNIWQDSFPKWNNIPLCVYTTFSLFIHW